MCELLDKYWNDGVATGMRRGRQTGLQESLENGLAALVASLKLLFPDFQTVLEAIRKNDCYAHVKEEQVRKY